MFTFGTPVSISIALFHAMTVASESMTNVASGRNSTMSTNRLSSDRVNRPLPGTTRSPMNGKDICSLLSSSFLIANIRSSSFLNVQCVGYNIEGPDRGKTQRRESHVDPVSLHGPFQHKKKGRSHMDCPLLEFLPGRRRDSNSGPIDEERVVPIAI